MSKHLSVLDPGFGDSFDSALRRFFSPLQVDTTALPLQMRIDVSEKDGAYQVKADVPGFKKEDINVRIDGNIVQIDAETRSEKTEKGNGGKVLRSERHVGSVSRTFSLAHDVDEAKAAARYADGVLTLDLPMKSTAQARKLTVQ